MTQKISIYDYINYREYLKDYYTLQKTTTKFFSYWYFSGKAGFSSQNVLKQVIDGQRNVAKKSIHKFCTALNLSEVESQYLGLLVRFNQSKNPEEKDDAFKKINIFKNNLSLKQKNIFETNLTQLTCK